MAAAVQRLRRLAYDARRVPLLGPVVAAGYARYFNAARGNVRLFHGLYANFAEAHANIPAGAAVSYDNRRSAQRMMDEWLGVYPNDYPVMFWLAQLLPSSKCVLDWGGNVGIKYFAYGRYIKYPSDLLWVVSDVPAVIEFGKEVAQRESAGALRFATDLEELSRADIVLGGGVLQFLEAPFDELRSAKRLPQHVLLNKVPVYEMPSAVTLHNMGTAFCPYRLFNRNELLGNFESLGYRLLDEWKSPDVACEIPFHPGHAIPAYSGFYFAKEQ